jgi:hypothetical protein
VNRSWTDVKDEKARRDALRGRTPYVTVPLPRLMENSRYVVTLCCAAPVTLVNPDEWSLTCRVVCVRCGREAGSPGVEDTLAVADAIERAGTYRSRAIQALRFSANVLALEWMFRA